MRILLVSNSARGHAIAEALKRSKHNPDIIAATTILDPGIHKIATEHHVMDIMSFSKIVDIGRKAKVDFAFVAPDDPVGGGLVDRLLTAGIPSVAPKKNLARIESSKTFARNLIKKHGIRNANPRFRTYFFSSTDALKEMQKDMRTFIEYELANEYVVKYDALKGGKGVKVSGEHLTTIDQGVLYATECVQQCGSVVIEEKLTGVEFSLMSFVSGDQVVDMPAVQDHKRAHSGDSGPNTGGMGTYTDTDHSLPFLLPEELAQASEINRKVAQALMKECNEPYKGVLYGGFMATGSGVRVIEYNARFGDPEALNVLPILKTDFVDICQAILQGTLTPDLVQFENLATVCKYITPRSYPEAKTEQGKTVALPLSVPDNVRIYYGDVTLADDGSLKLGGSRAIGIVAIAESVEKAEQAAEAICEKVSGPVRFRADVGTMDLIQKRIEQMHKLRGR